MAKCVILGANGFIGSHLIESLVAAGHDVRAFDRFKSTRIKFDTKAVEIVPGDYLNSHDIEEAVRNMDYVFHLISTTTPATADEDPMIDIETNIRMSVKLMEICSDAGIKKFIFLSTGGSIYGLNSGYLTNENTLPLPVSPYAIGKHTIEHYLRYYKQKHNLSSVTYRVSNPYGVGQSLTSKQGVIPIFLNKVMNDEPLTVMGDGTMVRDYVYVNDVAEMITRSFADAKSDLYNLGTGEGHTINDIIRSIEKVSGKTIKLNHVPQPKTYVDKIVLDTARFRSEFKLRELTGLEEGIKKTWLSLQQ